MRNIVERLVSVIGGEAAVRLANFLAALLIARVYGGTILGAYAASLAIVTIVLMFADNGLQTSAITELSQDGAAHGEILGQLYLCKTILILGSLLLLTMGALWIRVVPFVWSIASWVTLRAVLQSFSQLQMSVLKALSRANLIGGIQGLHSVLLLIWVWTAYRQGWGIFSLLFGLTLGQLFELLLVFLILRRAGTRPRWPEHPFFFRSISKSAPLGVIYGLANLIVRADTIVLTTLVSLSEVGNFSAANAILAMVYVASWLFGSVVLPEMVRRTESPDILQGYARKWARLITLTITPCALLVFATAPKLMIALYGPAYYRSGTLASIMALACPFIFLNSVYTNLAIATNNKTVLMRRFAVTAAAAVILDVILGRAFGSMGVAWAIVIREVGMFVGYWISVSYLPATVRQFGVT
jgi:O-antigen/teichoic acid export membrane protein